MEEIKNKRISRDKIKQIAYLLYDRFEELNEKYKKYQKETSNYKSSENEIVKDMVVSMKPIITFDITMNRDSESTSDIDLFVEYLTKHPKAIERLRIDFSSYYHTNTTNNSTYNSPRVEESFNISFSEDSIYYSSHVENMSKDFLYILNQIKDIIHGAPSRYDTTIIKKHTRENFPSETIALPIGLILTLGIFLLCKLSTINIFINPFILSPFFAPAMFVFTLLVGLIIPGKNHSLYRKIQIKKKYVGYNRSTREDIYEDDIRDFKSQCEVEIGKFSEYGNIRKKIEENYKKAKKIFWIEFAIFFVACAAITILAII